MVSITLLWPFVIATERSTDWPCALDMFDTTSSFTHVSNTVSHRPSIMGTKLLLTVIKAIIIIMCNFLAVPGAFTWACECNFLAPFCAQIKYTADALCIAKQHWSWLYCFRDVMPCDALCQHYSPSPWPLSFHPHKISQKWRVFVISIKAILIIR